MLKILVIEDDAKIRKNMARLLSLEGYEVMIAENGIVGLEMALSARPNIILCDILMPEMNGYEVLECLKQKAPDYFAPFIFVSAKGSKEDIRQGMILGADDYLTKPFTRAELLDAITCRLAKQNAFEKHYQEQIAKVETDSEDKKKYDPITGLPNFLYLQDYFNVLINEFESMRFNHPDQHVLLPFFVLKLDRDEMIKKNISLVAYQSLLKAIAKRVNDFVQEENRFVLLNDYEFVILSSPQEKRPNVSLFAESLLKLFERSFQINSQELFLHPKLGISLYSRDGYNAAELIQKSLSTITSISDDPNLSYQFYSLTFSLGSRKKAFVESELHYALERGQIQVFYQPQVDIKTKKMEGVEALARWDHPELGMVSPLDFIPIAEKTGLITDIGFYIMERAIRDVKTWQKKYNAQLRLAINLSGTQLNLPNICHELVKILITHDFPAGNLDIEITESILIRDFRQIISKIQAFQRLGCRIAMDDFGTGYSSLNYVRSLPWDILKIDRSFISQIEKNSVNKVLTRSIISAANELGYKVIAEGVETEEELNFLEQCNCDFAQGYLLGKPQSCRDLETDFFKLV